MHDTARDTAADAQAFALRRLLHARGIVTEDGIAVGALLSQVSQVWADSPVIAQAVGQADKAQAQDAQTYREAVAYLLDSVAEAIAAPVPAVAEVGDINALLGAVP